MSEEAKERREKGKEMVRPENRLPSVIKRILKIN